MRNFCLKKGRWKQWGVTFEIRWGGVKIFSLACGLVGSILKKKLNRKITFIIMIFTYYIEDIYIIENIYIVAAYNGNIIPTGNYLF